MSDSTISPVALITGASQRIGRAIAENLHQDDYRVLIHYHRNDKKAQVLADQLNTIRPDSADMFRADLRQADDIKKLAEYAMAKWQRFDLLINNASLFEPDKPGIDDNIQHLQQSIDVNVRAALLLTQLLRPELQSSRGSIINLVDIYSERPLAAHTVYSISKATMAMLTKSLALELAPEIRVNGISPGAILWPSNETTSDHQQQILNKIPLATLGSTKAICETVNYLRRCDYITGQIIKVDGGRSIVI